MAVPVPKPQICTWNHLSHTDATVLLKEDTSNYDIKKHLTVFLNLAKDKKEQEEKESLDKRSLIVLDLFYHLVLFSRRQKLRTDQLSALYSIVKLLHDTCVSTPYDNCSSCYKLFTELMVRHSVHRPPYSTALFRLHQVKAITDYVLQTYFKHFKLYKFAFTKRVVLNMRLQYGEVEKEQEEEEEEEEDEAVDSIEQVPVDEKQSSDEMGELDKNVQDPEVGKVEEESLTPEQLLLKNLITSSITEQLKKLQTTVDQELSNSDKKIMEKISSLEAERTSSTKGKKK